MTDFDFLLISIWGNKAGSARCETPADYECLVSCWFLVIFPAVSSIDSWRRQELAITIPMVVESCVCGKEYPKLKLN